MARVPTHYDNLKVSRDAPIEVIHAAYSALIAKYHPDLHPRAAALITKAHEVLSDPTKRRLHDEWIAEVEAQSAPEPADASNDQPISQPEPPEASRRLGVFSSIPFPRGVAIAFGLVSCCIAFVVIYSRFTDRRSAPAAPIGTMESPATSPQPTPLSQVPPYPRETTPLQTAAPGQTAGVRALVPSERPATTPDVRTIHLETRVLVAEPTCVRSTLAPNGLPWPTTSAYLNRADDRQIAPHGHSQATIDNENTDGDMVVKLFDHARDRLLRTFFLRAHDKFTLLNLLPGQYDIRYENLSRCVDRESEPFTLTEHEERVPDPDGVHINVSVIGTDFSLTLYTVPDGNTRSKIINHERFLGNH